KASNRARKCTKTRVECNNTVTTSELSRGGGVAFRQEGRTRTMDLVSRNFLQKAPSLSFAMPGDSSSPTLTQLDHVILVESPSRRAVGGYTWQYTTENLPCSICAGQSRTGCRLPG